MSITNRRAAAFGFALAALGVTSLSAQEQAAFPETNRTAVGDWAVECVADYEIAQDGCQLYQRVLTQDPNTIAMIIALAWSSSSKELLAQVSLPLGSDLAEPPVLSIDGKAAASFTWSRCQTSGCFIEAPFPKLLVAALAQGESAAFTVVQPNAGGIAIPLSLNGFTEGLGRIIPEDAMRAMTANDGE